MDLENAIAVGKLMRRGLGENLEAMSPPGFGGTTKKMAKDHPGISNPYALAWSQYEKGDKSHVKPPKGSGAKHVSEEVKKKRSKALKKKKEVKAGGPGSGRKPNFGGSKNEHKLGKMHNKLVSKGYTYTHSVNSKSKGEVYHYYDSNEDSNEHAIVTDKPAKSGKVSLEKATGGKYDDWKEKEY